MTMTKSLKKTAIKTTAKKRTATKAKPASKPTAKKPRVTVAERIIAMLRRPNGATITEVIAKCPMKPATARAAISVQTRQRGLKAELKDGRYRIA